MKDDVRPANLDRRLQKTLQFIPWTDFLNVTGFGRVRRSFIR
jgi:hypothetical protein